MLQKSPYLYNANQHPYTMKALKIIGIILAILVLALLIGSFVAPTSMQLEKTIEVNAPKPLVHDYVTHFKHINQWQPWPKMDQHIKIEIIGTDGTVGAISKWEGNDSVGKGEQEIKHITPDSVMLQVRFKEPFESSPDAYIILEELTDNSTKVTWGFKNNMRWPFNVMGLFWDMEAALGSDYQRGLDTLKAHVEAAAANFSGFKIEETTFPETHFALVRDTVKWSEMQTFFESNLGPIYTTLGSSGKQPGIPSGLYYTWDEENQQTEMAAAVAYSPIGEVPGYQVTTLSGKAYKIDYYGSYEGSEAAHIALDAYLKEKGITPKMPIIEQYITDPGTEPDTSKWLTQIIYLVE